MAPTTNKPLTGPPQALVARIDYLQKLLKHLPLSLTLEREDSTYRFYLDEDRVADVGSVFPEAGRASETLLGTRRMGAGAVARDHESGEDEPVDQPPSKKTRTHAPIVLDSDNDMPPSIPIPST
ncbi:hypothetical protein B0H14DRAFT_2575883 [Mycena olivaceomarginata]|nr:hypothetical protein B0H14DRAFT_2575883 [Mycena olivaceomarginata]